ncbi:MAG TPA: hypothetical protein VK550_11070 [Polyangiaceae bacterium]|nr:hypothetical protein [Polyangiaceae bacterium]
MHHRLFAISVLSALAATSAWAGAEQAIDPTLTSAPGGAQVRKNRFYPWYPAAPGRKLPADSELTCAAGCSVRTSDGSTLTLDPGALITVNQLYFIILENGPFASLGRRFELRSGGVRANVVADKKRPRTIVIGTPGDGMVAVRPGEAHVVVTDGRAGVASWAGGARVKQGKRVLELDAGQATTIGTDDGSLVPRAVAPSPEWAAPVGRLDEPQPLAVALDSRSGALGLAWRPVVDASGYRFEIASDESFQKVTEAITLKADQHSYMAQSLSEGAYYGRVIALDRDGVGSRPSTLAPLRVIAVHMPEGGAVDHNASTVVAPQGTSVRLSNHDHLEMAVDDHKFRPAASELKVDETPHLVRLRVEGDYGRETRLHVEPRALKAVIQIGPAWARWPDDAIEMSITIQDPSGRFDPQSVQPEVEVLLGIERVEVDWKREGTRMTARLAPRTSSRPEVLRVIVRDQGGVQLGRNFLEIEPANAERPDKPLARR